MTRSLATHCDEVHTVIFPGESQRNMPANNFSYLCDSVGSASVMASKGWASQARVVRLPDTTFFDSHPIAPELEGLRRAFAMELYTLLCRKPFDMGDDVLDGLQGAYHLTKVAHLLTKAPTPQELPKITAPALAIASGPSLRRHIDAIRALQDHCLIISCDSALEGLLRAGIRPHIVTPYERVKEIDAESFPKDKYGCIFAGNPAVYHTIAPKFDRHIFIPGSDTLYTWAECPPEQCSFFGQSTGTMTVSVAMQLTSGPIYLIGHDLAFEGDSSHWKEVPDAITIDKGSTFDVRGNHGTVTTQYWWDVFRREIEIMAQVCGRVVNTNAPDGVGAFINHTISGNLPKPEDLPAFAFPAFPAPNLARQARFKAKLKLLPRDARRAIARLSSTRLTIEDLDFRHLTPGPNAQFFSYVFRSVLASFSLESAAGRSERQILPAMATAISNALESLLPTFEEMATCG